MMVDRAREYKIISIHEPPVTDEWVTYTRYISDLLGGRFQFQDVSPPRGEWKDTTGNGLVGQNASQVWGTDEGQDTNDEAYHPGDYAIWRPTMPDLVIFGEPRPSWWQRAFRQVQATRVVNRARGSVLIARRPRFPLRRILWLIRDHKSDDAALNWLARLASASRAVVTLMPIVPAYPHLYQRGSTLQLPTDIFMENDNGSLVDGYVRWLSRSRIEGSVSRWQGDPVDQIRNEVRSGTYDLIVIAAEPNKGWERWLVGELVAPLLRWADRPVLIAR